MNIDLSLFALLLAQALFCVWMISLGIHLLKSRGSFERMRMAVEQYEHAKLSEMVEILEMDWFGPWQMRLVEYNWQDDGSHVVRLRSSPRRRYRRRYRGYIQ